MSLVRGGFVKTYAHVFKLLKYIDKREIISLLFFLLFVILASAAEAGSVLSAGLFAASFSDSQKIEASAGLLGRVVAPLNLSLDSTSSIGVLLAFFAILAGLLRIGALWINTSTSASIGSKLSSKAYKNILYTEYEKIKETTSADLISAAGIDVGRVVYRIVIPSLNAISSIIISLAILVTIAIKDPGSTLIILICAGILYSLISLKGIKTLKRTSNRMKDGADRIVVRIQETFNNFKNIILGSHEEVWLSQYVKDDAYLRRNEALSSFIGNSPRYFLEPIFLILIVFIGVNMRQDLGGDEGIQRLSILVVGIQRLLPQLQKVYEGWAMATSTEASLLSLLALVQEQDHIIQKPRHFSFDSSFLLHQVDIHEVSYKYKNLEADHPVTLDNITLNIKRGDTIAITGKSGSGKSTLIDIITGLVFPDKGQLIVNGINLFDKKNIEPLLQYKKSIAIVPQESCLVEGSILQNITLYSNNIDLPSVKAATYSAGISSYIDTLVDGYQHYIGEKGSLLSGGQRQRISIARCLYENPQLLILDEATSGIDEETEISVIKNIKESRPELTIILVTHRKEALKLCNKIIEI